MFSSKGLADFCKKSRNGEVPARFAKRANISPKSLEKIESGYKKPIRTDVIVRLALASNTKVEEWFTAANIPLPENIDYLVERVADTKGSVKLLIDPNENILPLLYPIIESGVKEFRFADLEVLYSHLKSLERQLKTVSAVIKREIVQVIVSAYGKKRNKGS